MITVLHGDNTVTSRDQLNQLIASAKSRGVKDIIRLDGKKLDLTSLKQALESQSLFGTDRLVVIEDLFKRPSSKAKTNLLKYLKDSPPSTQTLIWESKPLTVTQFKAIGNPKQLTFKITKTLFNFLDSIKPGNSKQSLGLLTSTLQNEPSGLVFAMLIRQTRLLLQTKSSARPRLAAWQLSKLSSQANSFTDQQLISLHRQLLNLDIAQKTSNNLLELDRSLDTLISTL